MNSEDTKYELGVIHGRFQVLHNDHVKYLLAGKELCNHIIVGITNPDPSLTKSDDSNPHRSMPLANPLTYYERYIMIREVLKEEGLDLSEFSIVPFPINVPELIKFYVPMDVVFFLTIYDDWGRQKKKYLQSLGLNIHVLWEVELKNKGLNSSDIREAMIKDKKWEHLVPKSVKSFMNDWKIPFKTQN